MDNPSEESQAKWHLGSTPKELAFADFQHAMICLSEAFYRYAGRSLATITGDTRFTGYDSVILNVIHAAGRPKSITDIQHFTNRSDVSNIQYSVRKLLAAKLIARAAKFEGRGAAYELTPAGVDIVLRYAASRAALLNQLPEEERKLVGRLTDGTQLMVLLTGLYDQASRSAMSR